MSFKGPRTVLKVFSFPLHCHLHQLPMKTLQVNTSLESSGSVLPVPAQLPDLLPFIWVIALEPFLYGNSGTIIDFMTLLKHGLAMPYLLCVGEKGDEIRLL